MPTPNGTREEILMKHLYDTLEILEKKNTDRVFGFPCVLEGVE